MTTIPWFDDRARTLEVFDFCIAQGAIRDLREARYFWEKPWKWDDACTALDDLHLLRVEVSEVLRAQGETRAVAAEAAAEEMIDDAVDEDPWTPGEDPSSHVWAARIGRRVRDMVAARTAA